MRRSRRITAPRYSEFDAAFVSHMIVTHEAEIAKYSANSSSNHDALATCVADRFPKLRGGAGAHKGAPAHATH